MLLLGHNSVLVSRLFTNVKRHDPTHEPSKERSKFVYILMARCIIQDEASKERPKFVCILMGMLELKLESCWVEVGEEFQE
jgi:hypothetical protein